MLSGAPIPAKKALNDFGVALVPGSSFGDYARDYVRISYANSLENIKAKSSSNE